MTDLLDAARKLLAFGRPKEGSDRYKAAWDELKRQVDGVHPSSPAPTGSGPQHLGIPPHEQERQRGDVRTPNPLNPYC